MSPNLSIKAIGFLFHVTFITAKFYQLSFPPKPAHCNFATTKSHISRATFLILPFMKNIFEVKNLEINNDLIALVTRLTIAIVLFPHGAQKLLGWWNGHGYGGTMHYFTHTVGIPYELGFLVIMIEFWCPILLVLGIWTRLSAAAIMVVMAGVIISVQHQYFFMDWFRNQQSEGMEFFLLMIGLCMVSILNGTGKFSAIHFLKR